MPCRWVISVCAVVLWPRQSQRLRSQEILECLEGGHGCRAPSGLLLVTAGAARAALGRFALYVPNCSCLLELPIKPGLTVASKLISWLLTLP